MRVIILTGDELRHRYVRSILASDHRFEVIACICEGLEKSLTVRTEANPDASQMERMHVVARDQSENDFFGRRKFDADTAIIRIRKGAINDDATVRQILDMNPDLLICYGSSLIRSELLEAYKGRFLNVHLGLSPYYRGSGTNVWPMINKELHMVGATFMHLEEGIDTGEIIHQIRASVVLGDGPHAIGNRLITDMANVYADIIASFHTLSHPLQPTSNGRLYREADWGEAAVRSLYASFCEGVIEAHLNVGSQRNWPPLVENVGFLQS